MNNEVRKTYDYEIIVDGDKSLFNKYDTLIFENNAGNNDCIVVLV